MPGKRGRQQSEALTGRRASRTPGRREGSDEKKEDGGVTVRVAVSPLMYDNILIAVLYWYPSFRDTSFHVALFTYESQQQDHQLRQKPPWRLRSLWNSFLHFFYVQNLASLESNAQKKTSLTKLQGLSISYVSKKLHYPWASAAATTKKKSHTIKNTSLLIRGTKSIRVAEY